MYHTTQYWYEKYREAIKRRGKIEGIIERIHHIIVMYVILVV